jgi:hypothetical protein
VRTACEAVYLPWTVGPFFFFSAPNSKCLQRPKFFIFRPEHFSHFILSVIFFVTCTHTHTHISPELHIIFAPLVSPH